MPQYDEPQLMPIHNCPFSIHPLRKSNFISFIFLKEIIDGALKLNLLEIAEIIDRLIGALNISNVELGMQWAEEAEGRNLSPQTLNKEVCP
jgi:hypothetical protein